jgi:hypothetical protein
MSFSVEEFLPRLHQSRSQKILKPLNKDDLIALCTHFGLDTNGLKKGEVLELLTDYLVRENMIEAPTQSSTGEAEGGGGAGPPGSSAEGGPPSTSGDLTTNDGSSEIEKLRLQCELQRMKLREKELELQIKSMGPSEFEASVRQPPPFDAARCIRLVPPFSEKEVDKYFLHFEKVATSLNWPKGYWPILLQSVFVGKAQEAYNTLTIEQSSDYEVVKSTVLKTYELVPEAYRQKFRNIRPNHGQTYLEFAREKQSLFNRWLTSIHCGSDFEKLTQAILLEEFTRCVNNDIQTYLAKTTWKHFTTLPAWQAIMH